MFIIILADCPNSHQCTVAWFAGWTWSTKYSFPIQAWAVLSAHRHFSSLLDKGLSWSLYSVGTKWSPKFFCWFQKNRPAIHQAGNFLTPQKTNCKLKKFHCKRKTKTCETRNSFCAPIVALMGMWVSHHYSLLFLQSWACFNPFSPGRNLGCCSNLDTAMISRSVCICTFGGLDSS